jgi:hypothetical protein
LDLKGDMKMARRTVTAEDKAKYGNLLNLGCQNTACGSKGRKKCAGNNLTCKWYEEPNYGEYIFKTKEIN